MAIQLRAHLSVFEVGFERLQPGALGHGLSLPPLLYPPTLASRPCDEWFVVENKYGTFWLLLMFVVVSQEKDAARAVSASFRSSCLYHQNSSTTT